MRQRVSSYEDLEVYQLAIALQQRIFLETKAWPKSETYALVDQIRRSSRSIGANIAESWAKRRYKAHFISKLTDSDGEQNETRHWLYTAWLCCYLQKSVYDELSESCNRIGAMLGRMLKGSDSWTVGL
ncbi:MAG: four helix bundle protein [Desulfatirhabdiaceae bacterium]